MVTGRVEEGDKVLGFELGADDYVTKPFSPRELVARVRAVSAAASAAEAPSEARTSRPAISRSTGERFEVAIKGRAVELTRKEFELLATLVGAPGRVFGREELLDLVWGRDGFVEPRTVDVHVARLRAQVRGGQGAERRASRPSAASATGSGSRETADRNGFVTSSITRARNIDVRP